MVNTNHNMRNAFLSCLFLTYCSLLLGNTITGTVVDENKKPVEFSNIILHKYNHATYLNGSTTDSLGRFEIPDIEVGDYLLGIVFLDYKIDTIANIIIQANEIKDIGTVQLQLTANTLNGVEISASRPIIERKADRVVYNVENSAKSSGENVMDLLRSVSGVTVSGDDQIRVNGKSEVQVMINGKVEQLNGDQLANLLESIQSPNVKKMRLSAIHLQDTMPMQKVVY